MVNDIYIKKISYFLNKTMRGVRFTNPRICIYIYIYIQKRKEKQINNARIRDSGGGW